MDTAAPFLKILIRKGGGGALILGLAFWLGYGRSFTQLHMGSALLSSYRCGSSPGSRGGTGYRTSIVAFAAGWER